MNANDFSDISEWLTSQARHFQEASKRCAVNETKQSGRFDFFQSEAERQAELSRFLEGAAQGFQDISFQLKDEGEKRKGFSESLRGLREL